MLKQLSLVHALIFTGLGLAAGHFTSEPAKPEARRPELQCQAVDPVADYLTVRINGLDR
jgi:hypothetical protein